MNGKRAKGAAVRRQVAINTNRRCTSGRLRHQAAAAHLLNGDAARAAYWAANVRERADTLTRADFNRVFPMKLDSMRVRVSLALAQLGL
jgi:hypothetical protein